MSKSINGHDRDIETILSDIRKQAMHPTNRASRSYDRSHVVESYTSDGPKIHNTNGAFQNGHDLPSILVKKNNVTPDEKLTSADPTDIADLQTRIDTKRDQRQQSKANEPRIRHSLKNELSALRPSEAPQVRSNSPASSPSRDGEEQADGISNNTRYAPNNLVGQGAIRGQNSIGPDEVAGDGASEEEQTHVKRVLPSFRDTRMAKMAAKKQPESEPNANALREECAQNDVDSGGDSQDGELDRLSKEQTAGLKDERENEGIKPIANDGLHDMAAELLRPMIKEWVGENMPQIVEKALQIERAEEKKKSKK